MFDADDPGAMMNELLVVLFAPGIVLIGLLWASFRFVFDETLTSMGLEPITVPYQAGEIGAGGGRLLLIILVSTALLVPYVALYARFLRGPLRKRGLV